MTQKEWTLRIQQLGAFAGGIVGAIGLLMIVWGVVGQIVFDVPILDSDTGQPITTAKMILEMGGWSIAFAAFVWLGLFGYKRFK